MADQKNDPVPDLLWQACIHEKILCQYHALYLLFFAVCVPVFFPAQRARNVMDDRGGLHSDAVILRNIFALGDRFRVSIHLHKMVDVMLVPI